MLDRGPPVYPFAPGDPANELGRAERLGGLRARRQNLPELAGNEGRDILSLAAGNSLGERAQRGADRLPGFLPRDASSLLDRIEERLFTHARYP